MTTPAPTRNRASRMLTCVLATFALVRPSDAAALVSGTQADTVSLLIRNGTVYDGTGSAAVRIDVGIRGDRIVFVGDAEIGRAHV